MSDILGTTPARPMPETSLRAPVHEPAEAQVRVRGGGPPIQASPFNQRVDLDSTAWAVPER